MSRSVRDDIETLRERQARAQESIVTAPAHGIASSSAFGAQCTCGHVERSTLGRMVALTQLMDHMEAEAA